MYSLRDYGDMIADPGRFPAYAEAVKHAVREGDVVVDLGCGPGQFALLACRAGARRVYAIDTDDIIEVARQLAAANRVTDRVEFIQSDSRRTELPERANVIVSDLRGVLPFFDHAISTIEDAKQRFLGAGGVLIPRRDTLKAAVVEQEEFYSRLTTPWNKLVFPLDLSGSLPLILNQLHSVNCEPQHLLTVPQSWCTLDYTRRPSDSACAELTFHATRDDTAHGLCLWFDAELFDGVGYSTGPGAMRSIYGQIFLPWLEAVPVKQGQEIHVGLQADLVGDEYIWRWKSEICGDANGPGRHFQQSTFQGANFTSQALRRRAADFVPALSEHGQADRWLLQAMDGKTSLQQMAQAAVQRFPGVFLRWEDVLHRAAELAERFSR
jgi:type I protein arginine methyltransferase